jgi:hypothetical protein
MALVITVRWMWSVLLMKITAPWIPSKVRTFFEFFSVRNSLILSELGFGKNAKRKRWKPMIRGELTRGITKSLAEVDWSILGRVLVFGAKALAWIILAGLLFLATTLAVILNRDN